MTYIGRPAPSPAGFLHLGHEDFDPHRSKPEFVVATLEHLAWLDIAWQLPTVTQYQRLPLYRDAMHHSSMPASPTLAPAPAATSPR